MNIFYRKLYYYYYYSVNLKLYFILPQVDQNIQQTKNKKMRKQNNSIQRLR